MRYWAVAHTQGRPDVASIASIAAARPDAAVQEPHRRHQIPTSPAASSGTGCASASRPRNVRVSTPHVGTPAGGATGTGPTAPTRPSYSCVRCACHSPSTTSSAAPSCSTPTGSASSTSPTSRPQSWGIAHLREVAERARAIAAGLDELGIGVGERVAMVSHNSARLLTALFGVSGSGRILVPINFRLVAEEVRYIVEHSGARVLLVDPELDDALADVECEHRLRDRRRGRRRAAALRRRAAAVGRATRTPRRRSTTRPARRRARRACS